MFRFKSISVFGEPVLSSDKKDKGMISPDPSCALDDTYSVDDSHFAPISEVVKRLTGNKIQFTGDEIAQSFDFASLKDIPSDYKVPFVRSAGYKDIAELSQYILDTSKSARESLENDVNSEIERQEVRQIVSKAKSKSSSSSVEGSK